jgi:hypothetical protein
MEREMEILCIIPVIAFFVLLVMSMKEQEREMNEQYQQVPYVDPKTLAWLAFRNGMDEPFNPNHHPWDDHK